MLIDIGLNLTSSQFDQDRSEVLNRAKDANVRHMVLTGTSVEGSRAAVAYAQTHPDLLSATVGIHPHDARHFNADAETALRELAGSDQVVALGECGLDHNRNFSPPADQARCFEAQIILAKELNLPLFMHERDAQGPFLEILEPHLTQEMKGVVHCFTGDRSCLKRYLDLGLFIGITGWVCDERRGHDLRDAIQGLPLERMMIETDAPYLIPRDLRPRPKGRRNEPMYLQHIAESIAHITGHNTEDVISRTGQNAIEFFGLPLR